VDHSQQETNGAAALLALLPEDDTPEATPEETAVSPLASTTVLPPAGQVVNRISGVWGQAYIGPGTASELR